MTTLKGMWERDSKNARADKRIAALEAALKPFADVASDYRRRCSEVDHSTTVQVTLGSCLRAESALTSHLRAEPGAMDDNRGVTK
jgi:hypothetical protein